MLEDLENDFIQGTDNYPVTLKQAYSLLVHWKQDPKNIMRIVGGVSDGVAFTNVGSEGGAQRGRRPVSEITCFKCGQKGHYSNNCPDEDDDGSQQNESTGTQLLLQGIEELATENLFQFAQVNGQLPRTWILLDNQSTVNIFHNKDLLKDVHTTGHCMRVWCNAGWTVMNMIGRLPGFPGEVWYNPNGIANILSLADTEKYYRV
jgi:hypothetical protein